MSDFPSETFLEHALLLATIPNLSQPHFLGPAIAAAATQTRERLVIVLFSRLLNTQPSQGVSHTEQWDQVQKLLTFVYLEATKVAQAMDKILLDIDVLLKGVDQDLAADFGDNFEVCFRVDGDAIAVPLPQSIAILRQTYLPKGDSSPMHGQSAEAAVSTSTLPSQFPVVALGGTFDHLHAGHKILLSMAAWITREKLIIGVTDDKLLVNKSHKHLMEPIDTRIARVRDFLQLFKSTIVPDAVPITDVYGPTGWDPNIQALVVSKETLSGAKSIASHRQSESLPALQTFIIDVISPTAVSLDGMDSDQLKQVKMSSTFIRQWIAQKAQREAPV